MKRWGIAIALMLFTFSIVSTQTEQLIIEGNPRGEQNIGALNPLLCDNDQCRRITDLLFPYLLNVDSHTGWLAPATEESGLVESWQIDDNSITYQLMEDRFWSDGTPITAYDVYFSYLAGAQFSPYRIAMNRIIAAAPLNERSIQFVFYDADCDAFAQVNFPVIPAHVFDPDFVAQVNYTGGDVAAWFAEKPKQDFNFLRSHAFNSLPSVTGGQFHFEERRYQEAIRLISTDGRLAYSFVDVIDANAQVNQFLRGELNVLVEPPYNRRRDIHAHETASVETFPGNNAVYIGLNLADPTHPQNAFDDNDQLIDQGNHPIFGDVRVRQAFQIGLDVNAMIDAAVEGDGFALASGLPPASWGFNAELSPVSYDPIAARQMLYDAGWRDTNRDGLRECVDCLYAEPGTRLAFTLGYPDSSPASVDYASLVTLIQNQMRVIGVEVFPQPEYFPYQLAGQHFDAFLVSSDDIIPAGYNEVDLFRQANDRVGESLNFTSYANDELESLFDEMKQIEACAAEPRQALYQQIQTILQEDQPYLWLFSPHRMIATRDRVALAGIHWEGALP